MLPIPCVVFRELPGAFPGCSLSFFGGHKAVVRPVPIPNTAVKRSIADGSGCIASARVGRRQIFPKRAETEVSALFSFPQDLPARMRNPDGHCRRTGFDLFSRALCVPVSSPKQLLRRAAPSRVAGGAAPVCAAADPPAAPSTPASRAGQAYRESRARYESQPHQSGCRLAVRLRVFRSMRVFPERRRPRALRQPRALPPAARRLPWTRMSPPRIITWAWTWPNWPAPN